MCKFVRMLHLRCHIVELVKVLYIIIIIIIIITITIIIIKIKIIETLSSSMS